VTWPAGKKVLVVGLGSSGEAAAVVLRGLGATPVVIDSSDAPSRADAAEALEARGIEVRLGVLIPEDVKSFGLVVASPGVPDRAAVLKEARSSGIKVISELELGYDLLTGSTFVAVTGTNGKTTTTRLIAAMLDGPGRRAVECGNIGTPVVSLYGQVSSEDILVCEVSSFQLQNIDTFRPHVAVVLNLAPDHFDWHEDIGDYSRAKMRIVENMGEDDCLVYNIDDAFCREVAGKARGMTIGFGPERREGSGIWLEDGWVVTGRPLPPRRLLEVGKLKLVGGHNIENVMAAAAASLAICDDALKVAGSAESFGGLEHRCEPAGEISGVLFYNDSKATNPHAAQHAVRAFEGRFVAIMGGRNKGLDFTELAHELCCLMREGRLEGVVLVGESAPEMRSAIESSCGELAGERLVTVGDLDESVAVALAMAGPGASVLFSPACASFDMFEDYKHRGRAFKAAVLKLAGGETGGSVT